MSDTETTATTEDVVATPAATDVPTRYAWSNIATGVDEAGRPIRTIVGTVVTAESLNLTDDQFQELLDAGAVRDYEYPEIVPGAAVAPADFLRYQAAVVAGTVSEEVQAEAQAAAQTVVAPLEQTGPVTTSADVVQMQPPPAETPPVPSEPPPPPA